MPILWRKQARKARTKLKKKNHNGDIGVPLEYTDYTVEQLSSKIEKEVLEELKKTADVIITNFARNQSQRSKSITAKRVNDKSVGFPATFLQEKLDELDRRTDDQIKRLVRKKLMKDAKSEN